MDANAVLETLRSRRTVRRYTAQELTEAQVHDMLVAGMSAPSMFNRRPWQFVVIRDPQARAFIVEQLGAHPGLASAPTFLAVLADPALSPTWRLDCSGAIQNMLLAATGMGLGAAWINAADSIVAQKAEPALREKLAIPPWVNLLAFVAVGHPAEQLSPHEPDPFFFSTHVHYNRWNERVIAK